MKIVVIGANGFLGRDLMRKCKSKGWSVTVAFNRSKENIPAEFKAVRITELNRLEEDYDVIFLCVGNYSLDFEGLFKCNVEIVAKVCRQFSNCKIVFISSTTVYGRHQGTICENSSFDNPNLYGLSKIAGEFIVNGCKRFSIVRPTYIYGPGMKKENFLQTIISDAKKKKIIVLRNRGERRQDYIHVDDVTDICIKGGVSGQNEVYLAATGINFSNLEIAQKIVSLIKECKIVFSGKDDVADYIFDPSKTKKLLNWSPKYNLLEYLPNLLNDESSDF